MPSTALVVTKALLRDLRVIDPDLSLEGESEELRSVVTQQDGRLRDLIEAEAEDAGEYLDDDEVEARVRERRLAYWSEFLDDDEALESALYGIEVGLPGIVDEMVGMCDMVVARQPSLGPAIAERRRQFARELEEMFAPLAG